MLGFEVGLVRSQYALSSTSASNNAAFPRLVGKILRTPAFMRSVTNERAVLRMFHRNSSRKVLIERRASALSWIGRMSERITSLEREERYSGPEKVASTLTFGEW